MSSIKQLLKYISKFGLYYGLTIFCEIKFGKGKVKLPGVRSTIHLRPGTTDAAVFTKVFLYEEYKLSKIKKDKIYSIVDAGSNIGLAAVYFSISFPQALVICIEPDSENFKQLQRNITAYPNIKALRAGVWNTNAKLDITNPTAAEWSFEVKAVSDLKMDSDSIEGVTIDKIMEDFKIKVIDVAKIDVEGSEKELFESNYENWLPLTRQVIIEVHDYKRKGASRAVFSAIGKYNFSFSKKGENLIFTNDDNFD